MVKRQLFWVNLIEKPSVKGFNNLSRCSIKFLDLFCDTLYDDVWYFHYHHKISPETYKCIIMKNNGNQYRLGGYKYAHNIHG